MHYRSHDFAVDGPLYICDYDCGSYYILRVGSVQELADQRLTDERMVCNTTTSVCAERP